MRFMVYRLNAARDVIYVLATECLLRVGCACRSSENVFSKAVQPVDGASAILKDWVTLRGQQVVKWDEDIFDRVAATQQDTLHMANLHIGLNRGSMRSTSATLSTS